MYTELHFNAELKKNLPEPIVNALRWMVEGERSGLTIAPPAPFDGNRWEYMLQSDSYYFEADTHSTLRFDEISDAYYLCVRCNLKNYDDEIDKFVAWITPHVEASPGAFLGFKRYEESDVPTLLFHPNIWYEPDVPAEIREGQATPAPEAS